MSSVPFAKLGVDSLDIETVDAQFGDVAKADCQ